MRFDVRIVLLGGLVALAACSGGGLEAVDSEAWVAEVCDEAGHFDDDIHDASNSCRWLSGSVTT